MKWKLAGLLAVLIAPYFAIFFIPSSVGAIDWVQLFEVWATTIFQSALSSAFATAGGAVGATFLLYLDFQGRMRTRKVAEFLALIPGLVPPLCLALGFFKLLPGATGLVPLIGVQSLVNLGFAAVALRAAAMRRLREPAEMSELLGARRWTFFSCVAWPLLQRPLAICFAVTLAWNAAAFTLPLLIGGTRATTLEVLIYQKVMIEGHWNAALITCLVQAATIFAMIWLLSREEKVDHSLQESWTTPYLTSLFSGLVLFLPLLLIVAALVGHLPAAIRQVMQMPELILGLFFSFLGSLITVGLTVLFLFTLICVLIWLRPTGRARRILLAYTSPSAAMLGLGLLMIFGATADFVWVRMSFGLALLAFPMAYRIFLDLPLQALTPQLEAAELLGADADLIFREATFPQMRSAIAASLSLAAVWAWGDYSVSAIVADNDRTLALQMRSFMGSYRMDLATLVLWMILIAGMLTYILIKRWGRVASH